MRKVYLTKGLPASGKSTWAKSMVNESNGKLKRVNKDDLRAMLDDGKYSKKREDFVLSIRDYIILSSINDGLDVIVDDTNLADKHEIHIRELVKDKANVIIKDFTDVPLDVCIERDLKRNNSVGEKVIRNMYNTYLKKVDEYVENKTLPNAIIVDIDGTLAKMNGRNPFDFKKVLEDKCNEPIKNIVNNYSGKVIVVSGRDGSCKSDTITWLKKHSIKYDLLLMRDPNNNEKDSIIKKRIFETYIKNKYYIDFVLDDRNQVVEMWRNLGLTCLQVTDGDF